MVMFGKEKLRKAFRRGDLDRARALLDAGVSPDIGGSDDWLLLEIAIRDEDEAAVRLLMEYKANAGYECSTYYENYDGERFSIFDYAIKKKQFALARIIYDAQPEILKSSYANMSPIHVAAGDGNLEGVRFLVSLGCDPLMKSGDNYTAHYYANENSRDDICAYLEEFLPKAKEKPPSAASEWKKLSNDRIAHITADDATGYKITDIFNFSAEERMILCERLSQPHSQSVDVKPFTLHSPQAIDEARDRLRQKGGLKNFKEISFKRRF